MCRARRWRHRSPWRPKRGMAWLRYSFAFFFGPALLGLAGAYAAGKPGAAVGIALGLLGLIAYVGWSLRR